jgi:hypothetical protein
MHLAMVREDFNNGDTEVTIFETIEVEKKPCLT